jgi:hypothetical protein
VWVAVLRELLVIKDEGAIYAKNCVAVAESGITWFIWEWQWAGGSGGGTVGLGRKRRFEWW